MEKSVSPSISIKCELKFKLTNDSSGVDLKSRPLHFQGLTNACVYCLKYIAYSDTHGSVEQPLEIALMSHLQPLNC